MSAHVNVSLSAQQKNAANVVSYRAYCVISDTAALIWKRSLFSLSGHIRFPVKSGTYFALKCSNVLPVKGTACTRNVGPRFTNDPLCALDSSPAKVLMHFAASAACVQGATVTPSACHGQAEGPNSGFLRCQEQTSSGINSKCTS